MKLSCTLSALFFFYRLVSCSPTENEPILESNPNRLALFPIKYKDIWQLYKKAEASFWTAEEIDLSQDVQHWDRALNNEEQFLFPRIFAFLAVYGGIVNENIIKRFAQEVKIPPKPDSFTRFK